MIRISQMKLPVGHTREQLEKKISKILKNQGLSDDEIDNGMFQSVLLL